ncbi:MAG: hypothetical protein PHI98_00860 [Eubacteriales bacterium]|nr:hypothetical protein [Eubacteriales bacterium]
MTMVLAMDHRRDWLPCAAAMLNGDGGQIYLLLPGQTTEQQLFAFRKLRDCFSLDMIPNPLTESSGVITEHDGCPAIRIELLSGREKPYFINRAGEKRSVWLWKMGLLTIAKPDELRALIRQADGLVYESQRSCNQDLTFDELKKAFLRINKPLGIPQQLTMGMINRNGLYTNLALILSDQQLFRVKLCWVEGTARVGRLLAASELETGWVSMRAAIDAQVEKLGRARGKRKNAAQGSPFDFPPRMVRETLLLLPRLMNFESQECIVLRFYDDRMELCIPGGFMRGHAYTALRQGEAFCRNPRLCEFMGEIHKGC